jgi:hypothetical protein
MRKACHGGKMDAAGSMEGTWPNLLCDDGSVKVLGERLRMLQRISWCVAHARCMAYADGAQELLGAHGLLVWLVSGLGVAQTLNCMLT